MKSTLKTMGRRRQRGNAMLELGFATPMLMLMLSGVIDFGRAFYFTDAAVSAARAGAQYGIESPANFGNYTLMQQAAQNDAQGIPNFTASATSYCQDSSGNAVACTAAGARGYVKVTTAITYNLMVPWPGLPNPLNIGGIAIMRCQ
jgi:Flp pilus assembly protein TadG